MRRVLILAGVLAAAAEGMAYTAEHDLDCWTHYLQGWRAFTLVDAGRFAEAEADAPALALAPLSPAPGGVRQPPARAGSEPPADDHSAVRALGSRHA